MKLEDYLHLYIGCEGIAETIAKFKTRLVISNHTNDMRDGVDLEDAIQHNFKPILRSLSDMTEEEKIELSALLEWPEPKTVMNNRYSRYSPKIFLYLLSKHFDLFGLIEAGLAIDKTKEVAALR
jgi:hypothetical protein